MKIRTAELALLIHLPTGIALIELTKPGPAISLAYGVFGIFVWIALIKLIRRLRR